MNESFQINRSVVESLRLRFISALLVPFRLNALFISLLFNLGLFAMFFLAATPCFDTNDDTVMMMISSGFLTGQPSEYLIQVNVVLGTLLKTLYVHVPEINWYVAMLYFFHFLAMTGLLYVFLKVQNNLYGLLLFTILSVFFELIFLTRLQFTSTAFMLAASGMILFLSSPGGGTMSKVIATLVGSIFIGIAALTRFNVLYGILAMSLPVLALSFIARRDKYIPLFIGILLLIAYGVSSYERDYYVSHTGKPSVQDYLKGVSVLVNDPIDVREHLEKVNWSKNDLLLLQSWFWVDKKTYSYEKIRTISELVKSHTGLFGTLRKFSADILVKQKRYVLLGGFCLILAFFLLPKGRRKYGIAAVITLFSVYLGLSCVSRVPPRVVLPLLAFTCWLSFYFSLKSVGKERLQEILKTATLLAVLALSLFQVVKIGTESRNNIETRREFRQAINEIRAHKENLFVIAGADFPYESIPLFTNPVRYSAFNMLPTGWTSQTPAFNEVLGRFAVSDIMRSFYEKDNIYLVGDDTFFDILRTFCREHYGLDVRVEGVRGDFKHLRPRKILRGSET
jgi:hypothetical protein